MVKKFFSIFLAFVLVLGTLPIIGASATDEVPTFPDMPDNWATKALESAVANGILTGYDDGKLWPDRPVTRAQMAAIITRAFGATEKADISTYTDVKSTDWFAGDIAKAVKMGVMQGYDGKMSPNDNITREQAFVVLARALKLEPAASISKTFADESNISDWAKGLVFAMVNAGYIQGSDGRLNPQASITRAEFAQVMYNIIKQYIKTPGEYTKVADGNIMVSVPGVTLKNVTINGDLIIGDGVGEGNLTLDNVTIKGRLVARGGGANSIIIRGGSVEGKVIISKVDGNIRVSVEGGAEVEVIVIDDGKDDVIIEGTVGTVQVNAAVPVAIQNATVSKVEVNCEGAADITVSQGARVTSVVVGDKADGSAINVAGQVSSIETSAANTAVSGTGSVGTVTAKAGADGTSVTTPNTVVTNQGASNVTAGGGREVPQNGSATNNSTGTDIVTPPSDGGGGYSEPVNVPVSAVSVQPKVLTLIVGETGQITATVSPSDATNKKVNWSSSDEKVATVDENGYVKAIAVGTSTITATSDADSSKKDSCVVTVIAKEPAFSVLYYTGKDFNRSYEPIKDGNVAQTINNDGSVTITVKDTDYIDSGFVLEAGTLAGLDSITVEGSGEYGLNLYFDLNRDGEFFEWANNEFRGVGADNYALWIGTLENGVLTVSDTTQFNLMKNGGVRTLRELKNTFSPDTKIGIWIGVTSPAGDTSEKTATITKVTVQSLFAGGDGTAEKPYLIKSYDQLKALEQLPVVEGKTKTYYVKLQDDIVIPENKYVNVPCYDLVMDLDNHTIFFDTNGLGLCFGASPYTRQAKYTIKNGSFAKRLWVSQMLSFVNVDTVDIENCYFYSEIAWEVNKDCNPLAVAVCYYSAQDGKKMTYNIKDCHFNETIFSVADRCDASARIDVNMSNVVFAGAKKTDGTYEYGRYSGPAFQYGESGFNYGRTYGDIELNNVKFFVKPTNNDDFAYDKCAMTIYTGSNAAGTTTLALSGVEYDAVTGEMGRNDHTPSMFVYAPNNYQYVTVTESGSNSYMIDGSEVDYKGVALPPVINVTTNIRYDTIQEAIDAAKDGETILVSAGTYKEQLVIDKPLTLLGPNAGNLGIGDRVSEAVITYPEGLTGNDLELIGIYKFENNGISKVDDVTIAGFTLDDGNYSSDTVGTTAIYAHGNNITIRNNIVDGFNLVQILISSYYLEDGEWKTEYVANALVEGNYCLNAQDSSAIYLQGTTGTVRNNTVVNAARGIQIQPYGNTGSGIVENNALNAYWTGIFYNGAGAGAGSWEFRNNTITATAAETSPPYSGETWAGLEVIGLQSSNPVTFSGNNINGQGATGISRGLVMLPSIANNATAIFTGNTFTNVDVGAYRGAGTLDLEEVLAKNAFPEGSQVIGNQIKVPAWEDFADTSWYADPSATSFTITDAADLAGLAVLVNNGNSFDGKTVTLSDDIDLQDIAWVPIGTAGKPFKGSFDGNGNKISNLYIRKNTGYNGLFGNSDTGKLENVTLENVNIQISTPDTTNYAYTGALAGKAQFVNNVTVTGSINIEVTGGGRYVGGIVGHLYNGSMSECKISGTNGMGFISAKYDVAALAGYVYYGTSIKDSRVNNIRINGYLGVGGVSGRIQNEYGTYLLENINIDTVILGKFNEAAESSCVGGFLGYPYQWITVTIKDSHLKDVKIESSHSHNGLFYGRYLTDPDRSRKCILENVTYSGDCTTESGGYSYLIDAVGMKSGDTVTYYSSIQYVIDAVSPGDTVLVTAGTFDENVTIDKSIKLHGANAGVNPNNPDWTPAARKAETVFTGFIVADAKVQEIEIDGFKFTKGSGGTGGVLDFRAGGYGKVKVSNCIAEDTYADSAHGGSGFLYVTNHASGGQRTGTVELVNNRLVDTHGSNTAGTSGVLIWNTDNVRANGNYFSRTDETTGMTSNAALNLVGQDGIMEIQDNYFDDLIIKLDGTNFAADAIKGNTFTGRAWKSNILEFTTLRTLEEIEFLKENNTYSPEGLGYIAYGRPARIGNNAYATIYDAVSAAQPGDTVLVSPGIHELTSTLNIHKSITVQGMDKEKVVLKGSRDIETTVHLANGATLKNLTVTRDNEGDWATNKNMNLVAFGHNLSAVTTVEDCIIKYGRNGVLLNDTANAVIRGNLIDNNRTGIQMQNQVNAVVKGNTITNNHTIGVLLQDLNGGSAHGVPTFTGNTIQDNWYSDFENRWNSEYVVDLNGNTFTDSTYKIATSSGEPGYDKLHPVELGGNATRPTERVTFVMAIETNIRFSGLE